MMTQDQMAKAMAMVCENDGFDDCVMLAQDYVERFGEMHCGSIAGMLINANAGKGQWFCSVIYVDDSGNRISKFSSELAGMHGHNECYRWIYDAKDKRGLELEYYLPCVCIACASPDCEGDCCDDDEESDEDDLSFITNEMFAAKLGEICENEDLLLIPGVYEIASEHFNNEVIEALQDER